MTRRRALFSAKAATSSARIVWGMGCLWLVACTSAELVVPPSHPGHPQARSGRVARTEALTPAYALETEGAPSDAHAHHHHDPEVAPGTDPATPGATEPQAAAFTCPMHPEVVRSEPGKCPICGMNLVPKKDAK